MSHCQSGKCLTAQGNTVRNSRGSESRRSRASACQGAFGAISVHDDPQSLHVRLDAPGASVEQMNVEFHEGLLTISVHRDVEGEGRGRIIFSDRHSGEVRRVLRLDGDFDPDSIEASYDDGVLAVSLTRIPEKQPRVVSIRHMSTAAEG